MPVTFRELQVADPPHAWTDAGFTVTDDVCHVAGAQIRLVGREHGTGIVGWSLDGVEVSDIDGIAVTTATDPAAPPAHPNGVTEIDHIVLMSPDLTRTVAALAAVGVTPRRERDTELGGSPIRQIFFRLGAVILEVVGSPQAVGDGPSSLWGITFTVADIDATAAFFGDHTSPVKDAVQPGRRITTLRHRDLGMSVRTALISPHKLAP